MKELLQKHRWVAAGDPLCRVGWCRCGDGPQTVPQWIDHVMEVLRRERKAA